MSVLPPPLAPPTEEGAIAWHCAAVIALDAYRATGRRYDAYRAAGIYSQPPIIELDHNQIPDTLHPMWEIVRRLPTFADTGLPYDGPIGLLEEFGHWRMALAHRFAYCILTPADIAWIVRRLNGRPVVEVGAGLGYWAWQLTQAGATVDASDLTPPDPQRTFVSIRQAAADQAAASAGDAALMMVWPPHDDPMAHDALTAYRGDLVIVCTEFRRDPCAADNAFLEALRADWKPVGISPGHISWHYLTDVHLAAYTRK
ncbi:hypothetical protein ACFFMN_23530 [Planobispora siamensis]|uniref:Uncharacterized protein n=1 Tax=Planobispora siamensis TaxID=936338 RepID=A0A8J3SIW0_9ACTN|nr:hypothetical protein [Planobispora siamensis]GIH95336.1 hypothetical protein Psi01_59660 [Planobispora siamensis]